ncbi:hypothetical protein PoB_005179900 [Plakobranchus ocellatus]|uniref:Protein sleepless n=1 Tax=Plakobranchus ocellatus TaxID=259542 RepID=A0AAV4BYI8_9GAST|nr:hypothetical protein PoB_005179900 [Plakobranchus ocellatus]
MCSICRSDTNPKCEIKPPPPRPCTELGSDGVESCSTVRIFNKETGTLTQFVRSCSDSMDQGCFDSRPGYKTCADICYTDGCNVASALTPPARSIYTLIAVLVPVVWVKVKNGAG